METVPGKTLKGRYWLVDPVGDLKKSDRFVGRDDLDGVEIIVDFLAPRINREVLSSQATIVSQAVDTNILKVLALAEEKNQPFIIYQRVNNPSLTKALLKRQLSESEALACLNQAAIALDYLHRNKIVHGQVATDNILLSDDNNLTLAGFFKYPVPSDTELDLKLYSSNDIIALGQVFAQITKDLTLSKRSLDLKQAMLAGSFLNAQALLAHLNNISVDTSNNQQIIEQGIFEYQPPPPPPGALVPDFNFPKIIAITAFICTLLFVGIYLFNKNHDSSPTTHKLAPAKIAAVKQTVVPSFIGLELAKAQEVAAASNLILNISSVEGTDKGGTMILTQSIEAGKSVDIKTPIGITVGGK